MLYFGKRPFSVSGAEWRLWDGRHEDMEHLAMMERPGLADVRRGRGRFVERRLPTWMVRQALEDEEAWVKSRLGWPAVWAQAAPAASMTAILY